jgi:hypothetical protein
MQTPYKDIVKNVYQWERKGSAMKQHVFREIRAPAANYKLLCPVSSDMSLTTMYCPEGTGGVGRTREGRAVEGVWIHPGLRHRERRMK